MDVGGIFDSFSKSSREQLDSIVVEFGIDRFNNSLSFYGSIVLFVLAFFFSFTESPITCFPNKNQNLTSFRDMTEYMNEYCWDQDRDDLLSNGEPIKFDPRWLFDHLTLILLLQIFLMMMPGFFWMSSKGGLIMGHIKHVMKSLLSLYDLVGKIDKVQIQENQEINTYDTYGYVLGSSWTNRFCSGSNKDTDEYKKLLETRNRIREEQLLCDRTFINMLTFQNIASLEIYPYLKTLLKHYNTDNETTMKNLIECGAKIHPLKCVC